MPVPVAANDGGDAAGDVYAGAELDWNVVGGGSDGVNGDNKRKLGLGSISAIESAVCEVARDSAADGDARAESLSSSFSWSGIGVGDCKFVGDSVVG